MTDIVLKTENLTKTFGFLVAVNKLNLEINRGDVFGFLGPNGAGKTTTLRMMTNLVKPTHGRVFILGKEVRTNFLSVIDKVGALLDEPAFYTYLTGYTNLKLLGQLSGGVSKERIYEVLELVGLQSKAHVKISAYSRGMRMRLGLAQALLHKPELLLLDEPTSGLDPEGSREIQELIIRLARDDKVTVVISSHLLWEIERICNRACILRQGELLVSSEVSKLVDSESNRVEVNVSEPELAVDFLNNREEIVSCELVGEQNIIVTLKSGDSALINRMLLSNGFDVHYLMPVKKSLEEYFLAITNENKSKGN